MSKRQLAQVSGGEEQRNREESATQLWDLVRDQYEPAVREVIDRAGRGPTLAELLMMEFAEVLAYSQRAIDCEIDADEREAQGHTAEEREASRNAAERIRANARQYHKAAAASRRHCLAIRRELGNEDNVNNRPIVVPDGLRLATSDGVVVTEELA